VIARRHSLAMSRAARSSTHPTSTSICTG
jgi:hypothetical protein